MPFTSIAIDMFDHIFNDDIFRHIVEPRVNNVEKSIEFVYTASKMIT